MITYIKINCDYDGGEFERAIKQINWNKKHGLKNYCSRECVYKDRIGKPSGHLGKKHTDKVKRVISNKAKERFKNKENHPMFNKPGAWANKKNPEHSKRMSGKDNPMFDDHRFAGENHPNWKGGRASEETVIIRKIRLSYEYRKNREYVFERDKVCIKCGSGKRLELDHVIPLKENIKLASNPDNCRVLCHKCHKETATYGGRVNSKKEFRDIR